MAEGRVSTVVAEVLSTGGEPNARLTTVVAEVLNTGGVPHARVSPGWLRRCSTALRS
jgi:hypothetical protein